MKVVYVAGPYRAKTEHEVVINIRKAEAVAIEVWKAGHVALCPHKNTAFFGGICPDEVWLTGDLEFVRRCDAVILVPGYETSKGALAEIKEARKVGIPIYESVVDIE